MAEKIWLPAGGLCEPCSLFWDQLTLVGPGWGLAAFGPSFVPCFKTCIEHLPPAQLHAGHRCHSEEQDSQVTGSPGNRKCW